eukprot:maker-scaffold173_size288867-snap-gene-1.18 protein:Tk06526 transcript:maker-scaffold173_size288867-snap-gene-1.18-mRNA-1 annotation:"hypothetical protein"
MGQQAPEEGWKKCPRSVRRSSRWPQSPLTPRGSLGRNPATRAWANAFPRHSKCGDCASLPSLQRNQTGQYPRRGHRGRQPQAHSGPHLDHHPAL